MEITYTISEISKLANVSTYSLRYYDKVGLFKPSIRNADNNYRYYTQDQLYTLIMIEKLKNLNLSFDEIRELNQSLNIQSLKKTILQRRKIIHNQIKKLLAFDEENENILSSIKLANSNKKDIAVEFKEIKPRKQYKLEMGFPITTLRDCIKILYFSLLSLSDKSKKSILSTYSSERKMFIEMSEQNLSNGMLNIYSGIGFLLPEILNNTEKWEDEISGGLYAVCRHIGKHETLYVTYKKLIKYLENNNYKITGNAIELALISASMTNNPKEFVTEIQIPVMKLNNKHSQEVRPISSTLELS